ncbi:hypothetical protein N7491_011055 [Penicillium cf. griseofulvum]|uniref:Uncharacterized protein n=1 Tax=Penicillium cf. griseofulvum TaxID=2972120 RepID=A0A9W9T7C4_9EURO|nr:hypothetical protein N7472_001374 [Penicillium cf. griseofulvum]KAJ5422610.1 hypothetical protein N7491_011055 [Penicillium cf. griseofulvum]KAJ5428787.1 hypothetical protein N7445_010241 [Penicillium cf. griseofulvum]
MPVFTIVHRVLPPLSLPWKRRTSLKGKSPINEKNPSDSITPNETIMYRDVHDHVHIAVNAHKQPQSASENTPVPADSTSESRARYSETRPTQAQLSRAVSWASIIRSRDRWTDEQEKELVRAQRQLGRCQKAWSSEQEVWLSYVQALSEEKEAHAGFLSMRHRQETEEQHQFRKAWKRRRSSSGDEESAERVNRIGKLRRLQRSVSSGSSGRLGMGSAVLAVEA